MELKAFAFKDKPLRKCLQIRVSRAAEGQRWCIMPLGRVVHHPLVLTAVTLVASTAAKTGESRLPPSSFSFHVLLVWPLKITPFPCALCCFGSLLPVWSQKSWCKLPPSHPRRTDVHTSLLSVSGGCQLHAGLQSVASFHLSRRGFGLGPSLCSSGGDEVSSYCPRDVSLSPALDPCLKLPPVYLLQRVTWTLGLNS